MKILRVTPGFYWPDTVPLADSDIGGVQIQAYRLTSCMQSSGTDQLVYTIHSAEIPSREHLSFSTPKCGRSSIFPKLRWMIRGIFTLPKLHKKMPFDIIQMHCNGGMIPLVFGFVLKKLLKCPLVYTVHCCRQVTYVEQFALERLFQPFFGRLEQFCFQQADALVFSTEDAVKQIQAIHPQHHLNTVRVMNDIVEPQSIHCISETEVEEFRQLYAIPPGKKVILYAGRLSHEKGWRTFFSMAEELHEEPFCFLICGDGPDRNILTQMIQASPVRDKFIYTGLLTNRQVSMAMRLSDCIVIPSVYEGFGGVVLEAACNKLPIIASAIDSFRCLLCQGRGILVPKADPVLYSQQVLELLNHPGRAAKQAQLMYQYVNTLINSDAAVTAYLQIYKHILLPKAELINK